MSLTRKRLSYAVVCQTFRQLVDTRRRRSRSTRRLRGFTTCVTRSRSAPCSAGIAAAQDVQAKIPSLSTYLGHREPASTYWYLSAAPELLALAAARQDTAWSRERPGHDPDRADAAGVLHRPARQAAPGESPHHRGLPRHPQAAAGLRAPPDRQAALPARLGRPGRHDDLRVPQPPGNRAAQQHPDPQRSPDRDPLAVLLRRAAPPRARAAHPACPGDPTETVRQTDRDVPDRSRGRRPHRRPGPVPLGRTTRPGPHAAGHPDRPASLRTHRPELQRRHPRHRRERPLRRQGTQATRCPAHRPRRKPCCGSGCVERAGRPGDPLFPTRTGRRLSRDAVALRVSTHAATAAQRCPSLLARKSTRTSCVTAARCPCCKPASTPQ